MYNGNNNESGDGEALSMEVVGSESLAAMERASIDMQIATARRYPRDFVRVKKNMLSLATLDEETAASCFYKLNREGKTIEGPSVRMAEIAINCFGNMRAGARIIANDGRMITAQGVCHDLENNVLISVEVKRRITYKNGNTYSDDMQVVTGNAACAIALRNAAYKVVPFALIKPVYEAAKQTAVGNMQTLADRRAGWLKWYAARGVNEAQVLAYLGKTGVDTIGLADIENLAGLHTAIKDGSTTVDETFGARAQAVEKKPVSSGARANGNGHPVSSSFGGTRPLASENQPSAENTTPSAAAGAPTRNSAEANVTSGGVSDPETAQRATPAQGVRNLIAPLKISEGAVIQFLKKNGVVIEGETLDDFPEVELSTFKALVGAAMDSPPALKDLVAQLQGIDADLAMGDDAKGEGAAQASAEDSPLEQLRTLMADASVTELELMDYARAKKFTTKPKAPLASLNEGRIEHLIREWDSVQAEIEEARRKPQRLGAAA